MKTTNYQSFQFLEEGTDYRRFVLAPQRNRVPSRVIPTSPVEEERMRTIMQRNLMISLHDHPTVLPLNLEELPDLIRQGRDFTGYEGLQTSGLHVVFDNMLDGTSMITSQSGWKWDDILYDLGMRLCDLYHQESLRVVYGIEDIHAAKESGQIGIVLSLEAATPIENELDRLDVLYGFGVRCMGLVYSEANALGAGLKETRDGGLTKLGRQAVRRMNQLGIAIDVSHTGDQTALDAIECSDQPIFITHAGARALWNTPRMKPDDVIRACAEKGGVFGVEAAPHTTLTARHKQHSIESYMEHFEYIASLVGLDHVAFGPDTLFGDHAGLHHVFARNMSIESAQDGPCFEPVPYVDGIESPEDFPNIVRWLVTHGYDDSAIAQVMGGNVMKVLDSVWR